MSDENVKKVYERFYQNYFQRAKEKGKPVYLKWQRDYVCNRCGFPVSDMELLEWTLRQVSIFDDGKGCLYCIGLK